MWTCSQAAHPAADDTAVGIGVLTHPATRTTALAVLAASMAAYAGLTLLGHGSGTPASVLYYGLIAGSAVACLARAVAVRRDRAAWSLIALGLAAWAGADIYYGAVVLEVAEPPYPSIADAGWLLFYPASYAAILLLARSGRGRVAPGMWVDGGIAALGAAALTAALLFEPILASATEGRAAAIATNLAYPIGDLLLLTLVVAVMGTRAWRPGRLWLVLGAGLAISAVADSWYLAEVAKGTYAEGGVLDLLWPASTLLVAWAAWQPHRPAGEPRVAGLRLILVPTGFALVGAALLVYDHFDRLTGVAVALAGATLAVAAVRMGVSVMANARMLEASRREAITDALTGLRNRRSLMLDVEDALRGEPATLTLFDLDGFKRYNDTFGHPAGDALLQRLAGKLEASVAGHGRAYRMGGDEFCVLLDASVAGYAPLLNRAAGALRDSGQGFAIGASYGTVTLGAEATTAAEALQLADQRMYDHKAGRSAPRSSETRDVLMRVLHERQPELHEHLTSVADLARSTGRWLALKPEDLDELIRAAELHDVGKMAIPDAILDKPGPLDEDEWAFMRRHTIIGESILSAAPALVPVARLVRSSHERYDGAGYPDRLAGEDIPLGSRIVAVCDAYDAMTSDRSYRPAMSREAALAELRSAAGTQFDAHVVEAFCAVVSAAATVAIA